MHQSAVDVHLSCHEVGLKLGGKLSERMQQLKSVSRPSSSSPQAWAIVSY